MVLPLILGAIAVSAGAFGVTKGVEGANAISQADERIKKALARYEKSKKRLKSRADFINTEAELYGLLQNRVKQEIFCRVAILLQEIGKKAKVDVYDMLAGASVAVPNVNTNERHDITAENVFQGILVAAGASAVSCAATTSAVTMFATASTGAAISGLSGAAANSALLAALGGGSLAAGGGGMALGSLVLGGITVGPAIAIGGFAIAAEGEKALTKATRAEGKIKKAMSEITLKEALLDGIYSRLNELSGILKFLMSESLDILILLENLASRSEFSVDSEKHMEKLRSLLLIVSSLASIMRTPIVDDKGKINPEIDVVIKTVQR